MKSLRSREVGNSCRSCRGRRLRRNLSGLSVIDLAACLPVVLLLAFGTIEATSRIFLRQSLHIAAYEATKLASQAKQTTSEACIERAEKILASRKVRAATVHFPSGPAEEVAPGETITVELRASTHLNSPLAGKLIPDRQIVARAVMVKQ